MGWRGDKAAGGTWLASQPGCCLSSWSSPQYHYRMVKIVNHEGLLRPPYLIITKIKLTFYGLNRMIGV